MTPRPLRVLLLLQHVGHLRKFESAILAMAARGHRVHVVYASSPRQSDAVRTRLCAAFPGITVDDGLPRKTLRFPYQTIGAACRQTLGDLRHLSPAYTAYQQVRKDADRHWFTRFWRALLPGRGTPTSLRHLQRHLARVEAALPLSATVVRFLTGERADVILVSPLVAGHWLADYVRAAARLGIPSGLAVASWDNLTTKGVLTALPDGLIVWNAAQRAEAEREFAYPPERIAVVGAHTFDHWFSARPSERLSFHRAMGLDPSRPYLLYVCSSKRIAGNEAEFVRAWVRALRSHPDPAIRDLGILIRPHYLNPAPWRDWARTDAPSDTRDDARTDPGFENIVVYPARGEEPTSLRARAEYFDALFHSAAVVGLNTTALIEAGIIGRPVLTVVTGRHGQDSMPHFHHLVDQGLVRVGRGLPAHFTQLAEVLHHQERRAAPASDFVASFVRPHGLDQAGGDRFAEAVETLAEVPPGELARQRARSGRGFVSRMVYALLLTALASLSVGPWAKRLIRAIR